MNPDPQRNLKLAQAISVFKTALTDHLMTQPDIDMSRVQDAVRNIMTKTLNALVAESENLDLHEVIKLLKSRKSLFVEHINTSGNQDVNVLLSSITECLTEGIDSGDWSLVVEALSDVTQARRLLSDSSLLEDVAFIWDLD